MTLSSLLLSALCATYLLRLIRGDSSTVMAAVSAPLNGHVLSHERSIEKDHSPWDFSIQSGQEV